MTLTPGSSHDTWQRLTEALAETPNVPCRNKPDQWFPRSNTSAAPQVTQCRQTCPVLVACLEHALAQPEEFGVWGGTTAEQRRAMRLKARRKAA